MEQSIIINPETKYIAIEGPVGSGKTSLAKKMANHLDGKLILEQPETNPFLENFYKDPRSNALPTELSFLFQRSKLLEDINQEDLFTNINITDFIFEKDNIFTEINLTQEEIELFKNVKDSLKVSHPSPDLVVYLQAPVEVLLSRIRMRSPSVDLLIDGSYLEKIADSYAKYFYYYDDSPLFIVNAENIDPINNDDHFEMLFSELQNVKFGKHFFNNTAAAFS
jgi:deoxyadenosine/deoxycytidine kinase